MNLKRKKLEGGYFNKREEEQDAELGEWDCFLKGFSNADNNFLGSFVGVIAV